MTQDRPKAAVARLFYREVEKVMHHEALDLPGRIEALYRLLHLLFVEQTRHERLQFSTLFARIAYVAHQHKLERRLQYYLHQFRRRAGEVMRRGSAMPDLEQHYRLGLRVLADTIVGLLGELPPPELAAALPVDWPAPFQPSPVQAFYPKVRVLALGDEPENSRLLVRPERAPETVIQVQYNIPDRNENFNPTIRTIRRIFGFPVILNLIDVEVDPEGVHRPGAIIVEPDYLIDVTAIAECFREAEPEPWFYLLKKYLPFTTTKSLLLGHVANFFLDELMTDPDLTFRELFPRVFQLNPLAFCLFPDKEIREIRQQAQRHFLNLKAMVREAFRDNQIPPEQCYLEPSFYSERYGLQGRLDLFYQDPDGAGRSAIVELKSGKPFRPNIHGLSQNHFTQTLLYDLLVRSVFGKETDPANYILYSGQEERPLRYAPRVRAQQYEAMQVRNQLVAIEALLAGLGRPDEDGTVDLMAQARRLFNKLSPERLPNAKGFVRRDLQTFAAVVRSMSPLEQKYFAAFSGFIAREQKLAKTGVQGVDKANGLAALWLNAYEDKQNNFEILSHLQLVVNEARSDDPVMTFAKTEHTNPLANFRCGDIAVLYPFTGPDATVLSNQIFKCTIVDIGPETVQVRLRSRQFNDRLFRQFEHWSLEHDLLDSSFLGMYRGLFAFADSSDHRKALLLTLRPPGQKPPLEVAAPAELTPEQQAIFRKLIAAEDYFLLWGPPGTGKTSMMLKHVVGYLLRETEEQILLLAYTNRAVDEICEAIERLGEAIRDKYLRIGSRYATDPRFRDQLLDAKIAALASRDAVKALIKERRIVVATVASMTSRSELLQLKSFDRVIIDEASQILEPLLVGLLPHFQRFVLIGDHKQLPAVVVQSTEDSQVQDEALRAIGLNDLRNSLFERLYRRCVENGWDWAYAQLSHQGRMHREIMAFPNECFYGGTLRVLPAGLPVQQRQVGPLPYPPVEAPGMATLLGRRRVLFLSTPADDLGAIRKINLHEAQLIGELVLHFKMLFQQAGRPFDHTSLGVITPYRAQIAQIRFVLESRGIDPDELTIDTVERYQGGARDVILISLCTNSLQQLTTMVSLTDDGVDRKLNVALTRAREQLVIIGNPDLLRSDPLYAKLVERYAVAN